MLQYLSRMLTPKSGVSSKRFNMLVCTSIAGMTWFVYTCIAIYQAFTDQPIWDGTAYLAFAGGILGGGVGGVVAGAFAERKAPDNIETKIDQTIGTTINEIKETVD